MNKLMKKVAAVGLAGAMMVGGAMTALAAGTYFYVYENGTFGAARMGQDCVASVEVEGDDVTLNLQDAEYGSYKGRITSAFVDENGNGAFDDGETDLFDADLNAIVYDQDALAVVVDGTEYANFCIQVTIVDNSNAPVYTHNAQSVYVPMQ